MIDDHLPSRLALRAALEPLDVEIEDVASGEQGLRRLLKRDYAAVLLDVKMPGLDGYETARLIRKRPRSAQTPILFITGYDDDLDRAYATGAVDHLTKPVAPGMLRSKINAFVELAKARQELERVSRSKTEFMSLTAHELRGPVAVINGYAAMLVDGSLGDLAEPVKSAAETIQAKAAELEGLLGDLLLVARLEEDSLPVTLRPMDVGAAAEAAVMRGSPRAAMLGGAIELALPAMPAIAVADSASVGRILDNLINNALTYCRDAPRVRVVVSGGHHPAIKVADNGVGIPVYVADRIFEKRFRVAGSDAAAEGSGLGLYIARQLAERTRARLVLTSSTVGVGSTFTLFFTPHQPVAGACQS